MSLGTFFKSLKTNCRTQRGRSKTNDEPWKATELSREKAERDFGSYPLLKMNFRCSLNVSRSDAERKIEEVARSVHGVVRVNNNVQVVNQ